MELIVTLITDLTFMVYAIQGAICSAGFIIFIWWWIRQKTASEVYAYITFLLLSTAVERGISMSMRAMMYTDPVRATEAIQSFSWTLRTVPGTIIMGLIVYRMAFRACRTIRIERKYRGGNEPVCEEDTLDEPY